MNCTSRSGGPVFALSGFAPKLNRTECGGLGGEGGESGIQGHPLLDHLQASLGYRRQTGRGQRLQDLCEFKASLSELQNNQRKTKTKSGDGGVRL